MLNSIPTQKECKRLVRLYTPFEQLKTFPDNLKHSLLNLFDTIRVDWCVASKIDDAKVATTHW